MDKNENQIIKVGITGASGVVGTALTGGLSEKYNLMLYDVKKTKQPHKEKFIEVDFAQKERLSGIFEGLDALIHLAGDPRPNAPSQLTLRNNFIATSYVFEEAKRAGIKKIVFASSNFYHQGSVTDALKGKLKQPITLDTPPTPLCLYAKSKVFAETVGLHLSHLGIQFVALRIGWTIVEDNPSFYTSDYMRAVFCSKRDLVQAFDKALQIDISFLAAFAVSDNTRGIFDLAETKKKLGFYPEDNAENYF